VKKNLHIKFLPAILIAFVLSISSCIEDNIAPPLTGDLNPVGEMLQYFESNGDFANSNAAPALIQAEEVFNNLNNYLLIDIRPESEFETGHIEHAVNVAFDSLYNFVEMNYYSNYPKIVLISKNGHSSSYFSCLLQLAGFNNIYTLEYGMASWNYFFASEWLNNLGDYSGIGSFTDSTFKKNDYTSLPQISFAHPDDPIDIRVKSRVKEFIAKGFNQGEEYFPTLVSLMNRYPVCYGKSNLYDARKFGIFDELGHPIFTRSYLDSPSYEFRSVKYLQTLPTSVEIILYDYNGQLAACMTAYLRLLGYNVKMILFGANQIFYSRLVDDPGLIDYAFSTTKIQNFPYVTGK
jgi:rhodanese-related sulfurtransferase